MRFEITQRGRDNLESTFQRHIEAFRDLEVWGFARAFPVFANAIQANFESEGFRFGHRWAPLSFMTRRKRRMLGYPPDRPILRRSGSLMRSLVDPDMGVTTVTTPDPEASWWEPVSSVRVGNQLREVRWPTHTETSLVVYDERFSLLNDGGSADGYQIPPRPMLPSGRYQEHIQRQTEKALGALLGELLQEPDWHIGTDSTYIDRLYWQGRHLEPSPNRGFQNAQ